MYDRCFFYSDSNGIPSLRCNVKALKEGTYRLAGEMIATWVSQGGPLPRMLDKLSVDYIISGSAPTEVNVEEMPAIVADALKKVSY